MVIKRDSLRAKRDFFSPMQGDRTEIRYSAAPERRNTLTSEVKRRLADIGSNTRRAAPVIEAIKTEMKKTADPFTKVEEQKSYAPQQDRGFADVLGQAAGAASAVGSAIGSGVEQVAQAVTTAGSKAAENRAQKAAERAAQRAAEKAELDKRFSGIETGLSNLGQTFRTDLSGFADKTGAKFSDYENILKGLRVDFTGSKAEQEQAMNELRAGLQSDVALGDQNLRDQLLKYNEELAGKIDYTGSKISDVDKRFGDFSLSQLQRDIQQDIATRKAAQDAKSLRTK